MDNPTEEPTDILERTGEPTMADWIGEYHEDFNVAAHDAIDGELECLMSNHPYDRSAAVDDFRKEMARRLEREIKQRAAWVREWAERRDSKTINADEE